MADPLVATGAREIDVPQFIDSRGMLVAFEHGRPIPFKPVRTFVIADVPPGAHRAQHVVSCDEVLWMAAGACEALVRHAAPEGSPREQRFHLAMRGRALYLPQGIWIDLWAFEPGSMLICLAAGDYVG
ncbi:MAG TPA: FdtA/QdtA family cupin domain-containing protein [Dongiaceae bacterium]